LSFINALEYFQKQELKMFFDLHLASSETSEQTRKRKFARGLKNKLTSGEIVNPFAVKRGLQDKQG
jgi:hypothetical protein